MCSGNIISCAQKKKFRTAASKFFARGRATAILPGWCLRSRGEAQLLFGVVVFEGGSSGSWSWHMKVGSSGAGRIGSWSWKIGSWKLKILLGCYEVGSFGVGIESWQLELVLLEVGVVFEVGVDI